MSYVIRHPGWRHPLHSLANRDMVINEYSGETKLFKTRDLANSYATLSHFKGITIEEAR